MHFYYKLDENKKVVKCTPEECEEGLRGRATDNSSWRVNDTTIGPYWISTIFLGIDHRHSWSKTEEPIVFETMIKHEKDGWLNYQERYCTWDEAKAGHGRAIWWVNNGCKED